MQFKRTTAVVAATVIFVAGAASGWTAPSLVKADSAAAIPLGTAPNYSAIVKESGAAVVGITTEGETRVADYGPRFRGSPFGDDPFSQFFRQLPIPHGNMQQRALGSGFIVGNDGTILTNAHVVRDAKRVTVKLADRREFDAKVVGVDAMTDIAVLKIDATDLPTVRLGDASALQVGDYVLAIGQPYGFEASASAGIVSAKGRSLPGDATVPFIQTDVALNPGNSGGPLFDAGGAVVGINSQIYSNTGGYEGVSFAIPIDVALRVQDQIEKHGKVEHARLGVQVQPLGQQLARSFKLTNPRGALVAQVEPDSAAARAGIEARGVIMTFNGEAVTAAGYLSAKVGMARPGDKATLEIWRDGKSRTITATLGNANELASTDESGTTNADQASLGLVVRPLSPEERKEVGVDGGLVVEDVRGAAAVAGIQPGDVVLSVNGAPVSSAQDLKRLAHHRDKQVALLVQRGDERIFVPVDVG